MIDWGQGQYEATAAELEPVAERVVALADLSGGEHVADLACGTGNAALLAARAGATVTGVDSASRLIEVASARAAAAELDVSFVVADVQELPFDDDAFDVALSVFGMIFAPDPARAFAEMVRVLRRGGRAFVSAWLPAGAIRDMVDVFAHAIAAETGVTRPGFAWHDPDTVNALAAGHGATARYHDDNLAIVAESPEAYFTGNEQLHPMSVAGRALLEPSGSYSRVREEAFAALRAGNEDPRAFRVTTPYRVIELSV